MNNVQLLEADVSRVIRYAASRSAWTLIPVMPDLFRISQHLEDVVRNLESGEVRPAPVALNRLSRLLHALQATFASPIFHAVTSRIEHLNLQLAGYAESFFMAGHPEFRDVIAVSVLRAGPLSEKGVAFEPVLRSA